ncbi:MAG: hypothetical protein ACRDM1_15925 [Gaiellaceae bacterium]
MLTLVSAVLVGAQSASPSARAARSPSLEAYSGSGSWVSIYDTAAWRHPEQVVRTLASHRIHTLFLETSNYRQTVDIVRPRAVGRFLDAARAARIAVVGWYLPSLANVRRDLRRAVAATDFRSAHGARFDSVALDIEATKVHPIVRRSDRAVQLAAALRRAVPSDYPLGAITIAPVGASRSFWPGYPFRRLAPSVDVILPMAYFTYRADGAANVSSYTAANLHLIRSRIGSATFPIHPIGGEADKVTRPELAAFLHVAACEAVGLSLWEYGEMKPRDWSALADAHAAGEPGC